MSAYEDVRRIPVHKSPCLVVVPSGPSSDMHHQHTFPLALETLVFRVGEPHVLPVAVAIDPYQRFESRYLIHEIYASPEVPCMPNLVCRGEEVLELLAENAVSV